ncbi:hypothetical protein BC342_09250 [Streptomyces olivaceus]|nr:hypothetical protein BC342_09250 [Streptomyces olivaceus]
MWAEGDEAAVAGQVLTRTSGEHTGADLAMFRSFAPAGAASPAHVHSREDKIVVMPREVPHAHHITSDKRSLAPDGRSNTRCLRTRHAPAPFAAE